ncbi:MAG: helix-turn-helix transcriptional regulator [Micrococcales bacterium]
MSESEKSGWTFLSNHAHVLIYIAKFPEARIRDVAEAVGVTERFAQRLLTDLAASGYVSVARDGRRNTYSVNANMNFRHPLEDGQKISRLLEIFLTAGSAKN